MSTVSVHLVPIITIFVRNSAKCSRQGDETYKRCRCSKHLGWSYNGRQYRQAAKTRSWETAEQVRRQVEARFLAADPSKPIEEVIIQAQ
jgi:integrase/recombinase XerD